MEEKIQVTERASEEPRSGSQQRVGMRSADNNGARTRIELGLVGVGGASVLDACCGSRMFWFDRADARAVFVDKRRETHELPDVSSTGGSRMLTVDPDMIADFTALPFEDGRFAMVVFDPPHLLRAGPKGWQAKKYGKLTGDWREMLRRGFAECFRVLRAEGTLIFKWNEHEIPVSEILALTPEKPLVGQRCGKTAKTHWLVFLKGGGGAEQAGDGNAETRSRAASHTAAGERQAPAGSQKPSNNPAP
jgi:SAM-dependent methyltransferase